MHRTEISRKLGTLKFKLDHIPSDEGDETDYIFEFLAPESARERNDMIHLSELIKLDSDSKFEFAENLADKLANHIEDEGERKANAEKLKKNIGRNVDRFQEKFNIQQILLFQEVDKKQDYNHVLEIFERVNSGGMVLSKSDLLFSTLKLKLHEMEEKFVNTLNLLNKEGRYSFNTDFLIKTCLVAFNQKAKYDVKKLRNEEFVNSVKEKYDTLDKCIRQMSLWLENRALIKLTRGTRGLLLLCTRVAAGSENMAA